MKTRSRWSRLTAMVLAIVMIFTSQPVSAAEIILGFGTESGNTNINKEEHMTETTESGTGETTDEPETELETEIGTPTPAELAGIGTDGPAIINLEDGQDGAHKTYDLGNHPGWFETGSRVTITSTDTGSTEEQFLPADDIIDPSNYPEFRVKNGYGTHVDVYWSIPDDSKDSPVKDGTIFTYQLPAGITFSTAQDLELLDGTGKPIGTVTVDENGLVTVTVDLPKDETELHNFRAHFSLWGEMNFTGTGEDKKVHLNFPGIGERDVIVDEDLTSTHLGFNVSKGLVRFEDGPGYPKNGWGADGKLENAVEYDKETGLIKRIWYGIWVTAESTNDDVLQYLEFDDKITAAMGGGEDDKLQYFHIKAKEARVVKISRNGSSDYPISGVGPKTYTETDGSEASFAFDLSQIGDDKGGPAGLDPGDRIVIIYPVDVDPKFWAQIGDPGGSTSEGLAELSGYYSANNKVTVKNKDKDENSAEANWSMQKEWLNKKGTVTMIGGEPYVHYEIYVYPTVSKTLQNWRLYDAMRGGNEDGSFEYLDNKITLELYTKGSKTPKGTKTVTPNSDGTWEYKVEPTIKGAEVKEGDYILISYYVRYEEGLDPDKDKLRNQIGMEIDGVGPYPVGIESSYYSLDKRCLSTAEEVAKTAVVWHNSPLRWETVIGSVKNASSTGAATGAPKITKDSIFDDVLACEGSSVYHYFTQDDIDHIVLKDGTGATVDNTGESKYKVTPMTGTYGKLTECKANQGDPETSSRECNAFRIEFKEDITAPVTVTYTSQGYVRNSVESIVYTNTSYFTPFEAGSMMSDTATLAYNSLDYLRKFAGGFGDEKKGLAMWYFLLNEKNNLEFGFGSNQSYKIRDILSLDQEFYKAYAVPYRNGAIVLPKGKGYTPDDADWEQYRVPPEWITPTTVTEKETVNGEEKEIPKPATLINVTEYLRERQDGDYTNHLNGFQPGDTIAIYVVTKIKKDTLFANGSHTLGNHANFMVGDTSLTYTAASQNFTSKALDKNFEKDEKDSRLLTYTVTVNEQGTSLKDYLGKAEAEVTVKDTLQKGLVFASDNPNDVRVEVFWLNQWTDLVTLGKREDVKIQISDNILIATYHDIGLPIRFIYDTRVVGGPGKVQVKNDVEVEVGGETLVEGSSDQSVIVVGGTAGADGDNMFRIRKVSADDSHKPVEGAEVRLSRYEKKGEGWGWQALATAASTEDGSIWNDYGLAKNVLYKLEETVAPSGYGKAEDIYFIVEGTVIDSLDEETRAKYERLQNDPKITVEEVDPTVGEIEIKDPPNKLTITKVVTGASAPADERLYSVTVTGPNDMTFNADQFSGLPANATLTCNRNTATFSVKKESSVEISLLPLGEYTVEEWAEDGQIYTATYVVNGEKSETGKVQIGNTPENAGTGTVEITNTYPDTGSLSVTKSVAGETQPKRAEENTTYYTIKVTNRSLTEEQWAEIAAANSGVALTEDELGLTFKITKDVTVTLEKLPEGDYQVEEVLSADSLYTPAFSSVTGTDSSIAPDQKSATLHVTAGTEVSASVTVTNTYPDEGSVNIKKIVTGATAPDPGIEYQITITDTTPLLGNIGFGFRRAKLRIDGNPGSATFSGGTAGKLDATSMTFELKGNQTASVTGLIVGRWYTISEGTTGNFKSEIKVDSGTGSSFNLLVKDAVNATVTNTYPDKVTLGITGTKGLLGRAMEEGDHFQFTITQAKNPETEPDAELPNPAMVTAQVKNGKASFDFGNITFSKAGTYHFTVKEVEPEGENKDNNLTYDNTIHNVTVIVDYDADINIYFVKEVEVDGKKVTATEGSIVLPERAVDGTAGTFVNRMKTGSLTVTKTVDAGDVAEKDRASSYTIVVTRLDDVKVDWSKVKVSAKDGSTATTPDLQQSTDGKSCSFTIAGGQTVTLEDLPVGTYSVEETSGTGFITKYDVDHSGKDTTESPVLAIEENSDITVDVTNIYPENAKMALKGTKGLLDGGKLGIYTFVLTAVGDTDDNKDKVSVGTGEVAVAYTENTNAEFTFEGIEFSAAGTYTLTVKEKQTDDKDATAADEKVYTVHITVEKNADGDYEVTSVTAGDFEGELIADGDVYTMPTRTLTGSDDKEVTATFLNRTKRGDLSVMKDVTGGTASAHSGDTYTIEVTREGTDWTGVKATVGEMKQNRDLTPLTKDGVQNGVQFTIDADETVTLHGLPVGEYTVTETTTDGAQYTATYKTGQTATVEDNKTVSVTVMNIYPEPTSLTFSGTKTLTGARIEGSKLNHTFTFKLYKKNESGYTELDSQTVEEPIRAGQTFKFEQIDYSSTGTYKYLIKEEATNANGYTFDEKEYHITVDVARNKEDELEARIVSVTDEDGKPIEGFTSTTPVTASNGYDFANEFTYGELRVKKEALAGGYAGHGDDAFTFTVEAALNPADVTLAKSDAALEIDGEPAAFDSRDGNTVTFTLTAEQTATLKNLPLGTYTVTEGTGDYQTAYQMTVNGGTSEGNEVTLSKEQPAGSVSVTNTYPSNGALQILKTTEGTWIPDGVTYMVTIAPADGTEEDLSETNTNIKVESATVQSRGENALVLQVTAGVTATVTGLKPGNYTVAEADGEGYSATYSVGEANTSYVPSIPTAVIRDNATEYVNILNTYENKGSLTVTKEVAGGARVSGESYTLSITEAGGADLGDAIVSGDATDVTVTEEQITFTLKEGESATIENLPTGMYEVTEETQDGFRMSYTYAVGEGTEAGPVPLGRTADGDKDLTVTGQAVTVTNTYPDKITLGIEGTKGLLGRAIAEGDNFTFEISEARDDSSQAELPTEKMATAAVDGTFTFGDVTFGATGTYNFTVHEVAGSDENIIYDDASYNVAVKVDYNVDGNSYYVSDVTVTDAEGAVLKTYDAEEYAEGKVTLPTGTEGTTFVNEAKKGSLSIHKANVDGAQTDEFTFSVKINDTLYEGEAKVNGVPVQVTGGQIILKGGDTAVIEGILCGSRYEVTETADEAYETTVPENAEGTIGAATPDVTVSYTNTYTTNDVTFQPSVTKVLTGREPIADEAYTFVEKIEKIDTEGSRTTLAEGIERTITLRQAKEAVFDEDTYTKADRGCTYIYTISEAAPAEDEKGITYDRTVYTVEVAIVDDGEGNLTAEVASDPAGRDVAVIEETADDGTIRVSAAMTFTNTYTASGSAEIGTTKTLNGHTLSAGEFTFELWAADAEGSVTGTAALQTVKNGAGADPGAVKFAPVEYTLEDVGTHHYVITEQAPEEDADGITYDREPVHVIVEVTDNSDGTLNTEVTLDGEHTAFVNTYTASGSAEIATTKTLTGRALSAGEFTFELWAADANGSVTGTAALQTVKNGAGADPGAVRFAPVEYTLEDAGTHHYVIREQAPAEDAGGIAYDREPVQVTVEVTDNGDGTLGTEVTLDGEHTAFTNTYTADGTFKMNGSKTLTGSRAAAIGADEFRFLVEEVTTAADGTETRTQAATGTTLAGGMIDFTEIAYTLEDVGTHTYVVSETVPAEADRNPSITYSTQTFTVTVTVADGGQGNLTVTPAYPEGGVAFVNDYTANGTFTINNVQKTLTGAALAAGQFSFQLRDAAGTVLQTKTNAADGSVAFDPIAYTQADIGKDFVYTVTEAATNAAGVTFDSSVYTVTAHVADAGGGQLTVTSQTTLNGQAVETMAFANAFAGSVTLTKTSTNGNLLPGAAFQLYARGADGWYIYNAAYADGTYTTGIDGTLTVAGLPANDYYFIETQAPAGHVITTNADGTPVQYPFTIAPEGSGIAGAQVNAALAVTNQPQPVDTTLVVTKQLTYLEDLWTAVDDTFYVALYADEALTQRVSEIQPIRFQNQSASSTEFTGLEPGRTYYVGEVNAEGAVLNSVGGMTADGAMFLPVFVNGNSAAITEGGGTQSVFFQNAFQELPQEYYREGQLTITKQLLGADGTAKAGNGTFYAGIFADEAYTTLAEGVSSNIVALNLNGRDTASDTVSVTIAPDERVTLYVTETDAEGHPVEGAASFAYDVTVDGALVSMTLEDSERTVVITNQEHEEAETETETELQTEEKQEDEILSQGSETHESGDEALEEGPAVKAGTGSVKTGDETPLGLYVGLMTAAALLLLILFLTRRRRRIE